MLFTQLITKPQYSLITSDFRWPRTFPSGFLTLPWILSTTPSILIIFSAYWSILRYVGLRHLGYLVLTGFKRTVKDLCCNPGASAWVMPMICTMIHDMTYGVSRPGPVVAVESCFEMHLPYRHSTRTRTYIHSSKYRFSQWSWSSWYVQADAGLPTARLGLSCI